MKITDIFEARYFRSRLPFVEGFDDYHTIEYHSMDLQEKTGLPIIDEELGFIQGMPGHAGYIGLYYHPTRPPHKKIVQLVADYLEQHHPHPNAANFAECIANHGGVYYDEEGGNPQTLYCEN